MAKLTDKQKKEIITEYVSGKSQNEIAKKFQVSHTAISKILKDEKSFKNGEKSFNATELRNAIIEKASNALYGSDFNKMHPETLLKIIDRLSLLQDKVSPDKIENGAQLKIVVEKKVIDLTKDKDNADD